MNFIKLVPVFFSSALIAAHFLRRGSIVLVGLCLAMPLLLLFPRRWAARLVQIYLFLGGTGMAANVVCDSFQTY